MHYMLFNKFRKPHFCCFLRPDSKFIKAFVCAFFSSIKVFQDKPSDVIEPHEKTGLLHCENKDTDQLRSNCAADQRLCFRYSDSTIPLLPKSEISSL